MVQLWLNAKCKQGGQYAALKSWNNTSKNILQQPTLMSILAVHPPRHMKNRFDVLKHLCIRMLKMNTRLLNMVYQKPLWPMDYTGTRPLDYVWRVALQNLRKILIKCLQFLAMNVSNFWQRICLQVQHSFMMIWTSSSAMHASISTRMTFKQAHIPDKSLNCPTHISNH